MRYLCVPFLITIGPAVLAFMAGMYVITGVGLALNFLIGKRVF